MNERRSLKILMIIILQLTGLPFAFSANLNEESKILEVGYCRRLWDSETMNVQIKCHRGKIVGVIERTSGKKIESRSRVLVSLKKYKAFEDYVVNNGIVYLKSIRLLDNSMDEKLFNESLEFDIAPPMVFEMASMPPLTPSISPRRDGRGRC